MGRSWTARGASDFVKMQEAVTSENVAPWMGFAGNRQGWDHIGKARAVFMEASAERRDRKAREISRYCARATSYDEAVQMLNANDCRSATGQWPVDRLGDFVRRYEAAKAVRLTPTV